MAQEKEVKECKECVYYRPSRFSGGDIRMCYRERDINGVWIGHYTAPKDSCSNWQPRTEKKTIEATLYPSYYNGEVICHKCSNCEFPIFKRYETYDECPHCGAKFIKKENEK